MNIVMCFLRALARIGGNRRSSKSLGASAVEFALVLPILAGLSMGMIETGNLFMDWLTLQKAAQSGARFATTGQGEDDGNRLSLIQAEAARMADNLPGAVQVDVRSWSDISMTGDGMDGNAGSPCLPVEVSVSTVYEPLTPIIGPLLPSPLILTGSDRKINEPWEKCG